MVLIFIFSFQKIKKDKIINYKITKNEKERCRNISSSLIIYMMRDIFFAIMCDIRI